MAGYRYSDAISAGSSSEDLRLNEIMPLLEQKFMSKTKKDIKLTPQPVNRFDDSDYSFLTRDKASLNKREPEMMKEESVALISVQQTPKLSNYFTLSLLEQICMMYEGNPHNGRKLFKILCSQLSKMKLISPLSKLDEISSLRSMCGEGIRKLIIAAKQTMTKPLPRVSWVTDDPVLSMSVNHRIFSLDNVADMCKSRYVKDFDEIERLGSGGFGSVYKVKNRLDGFFYAVKKIHFSDVKEKKCMSNILREVKTLAELRSEYIVGYNGAWFEENNFISPAQSAEQSSEERSSPARYPNRNSDDIVFESEGSEALSSLRESGEHSNVVAQQSASIYSDQSIFSMLDDIEIDGEVMTSGKDSSDISEDGSSSGGRKSKHCFGEMKEAAKENVEKRMILRRSVSYDPTIHKESLISDDDCPDSPITVNIMLYIQMELCSQTLRAWLSDRSKTNGMKSFCQGINTSIFHQILKGVDFIHSKGIIHRDLKPVNIFLQAPDLNVKIGDFGLATKVDYYKEKQLGDDGEEEAIRTFGVGTQTYASPEQLSGTDYDSKADMFSLGVILYEIFQIYGTEMERSKSIENLRKGIICKTFNSLWPEQSKAIEMLMQRDALKRPSARDLLESELFLSKEKLIRKSRKKISELERTVQELRIQLKKKDEIIDGLQNRNFNFKWPCRPI